MKDCMSSSDGRSVGLSTHLSWWAFSLRRDNFLFGAAAAKRSLFFAGCHSLGPVLLSQCHHLDSTERLALQLLSTGAGKMHEHWRLAIRWIEHTPELAVLHFLA